MTRSSPDRDKVRARLQALQAKTVANGCTEEEALAAAEKVAELLDLYHLSLGELELRRSRCERLVLETDRKLRVAMGLCIPAIAAYCDCKVWRERDAKGQSVFVLFGLPGALETASFVHDAIAAALRAAWANHSQGRSFIRHAVDEKGSFLIGVAVSLADRLDALKHARNGAHLPGGGRALVEIRQSVVESEFARLGLTFRQGGASGKRLSPEAFDAGRTAGHTAHLPGDNDA
ncbi:hypothetical protein CKO38_06870 [Rhodospirillum rubrum]|uniref:DUF7168 domain-containing protein n=1 Tax=Rhodospirillum rubrum TaxID=1085 RepID=UPI001905CC85|nr:DUF2786 domain-containing protein [Rhodospirillum rubrum]MBK1665153.1 hypothetical protein [Rhodospirillum rubrum]MBK1676398.1 hypothetical protein [Rhodospirillum rubrum]